MTTMLTQARQPQDLAEVEARAAMPMIYRDSTFAIGNTWTQKQLKVSNKCEYLSNKC